MREDTKRARILEMDALTPKKKTLMMMEKVPKIIHQVVTITVRHLMMKKGLAA
jgi:hypothetical protein